jgi:hypothetical protein
MDFRYVNGSQNGVFHSMSPGNLTFKGSIWVYSKDPGYRATPLSVTQYVYDTDGIDTLVCQITKTPSSRIGTKVSFLQVMRSHRPGRVLHRGREGGGRREQREGFRITRDLLVIPQRSPGRPYGISPNWDEVPGDRPR